MTDSGEKMLVKCTKESKQRKRLDTHINDGKCI